MRRTSIRLLSLILYLFSCCLPQASAQRLNLEEFLAQLSSQSLVLEQSKNRRLISREESNAARSALLPGAGMSVSYQRDFTRNYLFLNDDSGFFPEKFRTNFNNNVDANVFVEQALFDRQASINYSVALLNEQHAALSHQALLAELVYQGSRLFWQTLYAKEVIAALVENSAFAKSQWQQMAALFEQGQVSELQVQQTRLFYQRTLPQLRSVRNDYQKLLSELKVMINKTPGDTLVLLGEIEPPSEELVLPKAVGDNEQLLLLRKENEMAMMSVQAFKAANNPTIRLRTGYNFNSQNDRFTLNNNNKLFYGQLTFELPILTGGLNRAQVQKAKINQENSSLALQNMGQNLEKDLSNARLLQESALSKIALQKEAIRLAEKELEIVDQSLALGIITPLETKEVRVALTQARIGLLEAWLELRLAMLEFKKLHGSLNDKPVTQR